MADWPQAVAGAKWEGAGTDAAASKGKILTASTANAEPASYTEIIASTAFNACGFYLQILPDKVGTVTNYLVDIAFGAASNERDILTDVYVHRSADTDGTCDGFNSYVPIAVPAGTRLSGRVRSNLASGVVEVIVSLCAQGFLESRPCSKAISYGQDTTDSGALLVDTGTTANTLVWTEFSASITYPIRYLIISVGFREDTARAIAHFLLKVARGASGAEANNVMFQTFMFKSGAGDDEALPNTIGPLPVGFNAGDRLAVGAQCSLGNDANRLFDCQLIGMH